MVTFVTNSQLDALERAQAEQTRAAQQPQQVIVQGLAGYIRRSWDAAVRHKVEVEERMLRNLRNRKGEYAPDRLQKIRETGGSEIFMMLGEEKCFTATSWLREVLLGTGDDRGYECKPTPIPELPPQDEERATHVVGRELAQAMQLGQQIPDDVIMARLDELKTEMMERRQEAAKEAARRMTIKIEDQLAEGGWFEAMDEIADDLTWSPTAILKGPTLRRRKRLKWTGGPIPQVTDELVLEWDRVSPWDFYPAPHVSDLQRGYTCEKLPLMPADLRSYIGVPGYSEAAIQRVLEQHGRGGLRGWLWTDAARERLEARAFDTNSPENPIEGVRFMGDVLGVYLLEWGMPENMIEPTQVYPVDAILVGSEVIRAVLNPHPLGKKPYFAASWSRVPGSFWGNSLLCRIADCIDMCNAAARALHNNMGLASGPQVAINSSRLPIGAKVTKLQPWKIWQFTANMSGTVDKPIEFFQPSLISAELMQVFEFFSNIADNVSGMPKYMGGSNRVTGAARTSSGLAMLTDHAGKGIKQVVGGVDRGMVEPALQMLYTMNMMTAQDPDLKGDAQIRAIGARVALQREALRMRRNELLQATANPLDSAILGAPGRATLIREQARDLGVPVDDLVPSKNAAIVQGAIMQALQQGGGGALLGGRASPPAPAGPGQNLPNGAPIADTFSPG